MTMMIAGLIFVGTLAVIFTEKLHRTIIATAGAAVMVGAGLFLGFYNEEKAVEAIDFPTIGLLLGMMVLVALLRPTGFFEYLATLTGKWSRGNPLYLMILLGVLTTLLSMFLDNVTTIVLISPVTILICEILGVNPIPFLITQTILSNTGGAGTLVGDPPNILIGSAAELPFTAFLANALPIVAVVWIVSLSLLLFFFRFELRKRPSGAEAIMKFDPATTLDDPVTARKVLIVLGVTLVLFFVHHLLHLSPSFIALSAATAAMVWVRPDVNQLLENLEWGVLIFFTALFILVGGLEAAGILDEIAAFVASISDTNPVIFGVSLIWMVAALSSIVDNIPITVALIPVIQTLDAEGIEVSALWWALVLGAGFGGNGTIIGSSANMVVVGLSERTRTPINSKTWNRYGLPVMGVACIVATILFVLLFPWLSK
jgi:Na+/H+ antiporter NhaD/arsenite permease-like protein